MQIIDLITELAAKDIRLFLEDGALRFDAPQGAMTEALASQIKAHKTEVIAFLSQQNQSLTLNRIERVEENYAVSSTQKRFWLLHQLDPKSTAYHIQGSIKLTGAIDINRLSCAFDQLIEQHEILRTQYIFIDGEIKQTIQPNWKPLRQLSQFDFSDDTWLGFLQSSLDIASGLPIKACLMKQADQSIILCFKVHHIACDGIGLQLLFEQLLKNYQQPSDVADSQLAIQYLDYAAHSLKQAKPDTQFWQQQLKDLPALSLPTSTPLQTQSNQHAMTLKKKLSISHTEQLKALAKNHATSLYSVGLSLYALCLHYYSRNKDFAIGIPVSLRQDLQLTEMLGCFVNTLAIRVNLDESMHFDALLDQVKSTLNQAYQNQNIPFENVLADLDWDHEDPYPLFNTLFNMQTASAESLQLGELTARALEDPYKVAQYPLKMTIIEGDQLHINLEYQAAHFDSQLVGNLLDDFIKLTEQVITEQKRTLGSLFSEVMPTQLYLSKGEFNDTATPIEHHRIEHLISKQAIKTPHAIAVFDQDRTYTYQVLLEQSHQLAHILLTKVRYQSGVIALLYPRSLEVIVTKLAILQAGFAYLPVPIDIPYERQRNILQQADIDLLIVPEKNDVNYGDAPVLSLTECDLSKAPITPPEPKQVNPLFNVIFTSGSTGNPKGVMVGHKAIQNRLVWMQSTFPLSANDKLIQKTPYHFDVSVWEFFWPLMFGASCFYPAPETHVDPKRLIEDIKTYEINHIHFVPSMLSHFIQQQPNFTHELKTIFSSGEALSTQLVTNTCAQLPRTALVNLYGPTEAAIDVSFYLCHDNKTAPIPIGRPINNIQLHVLDDHLCPVPKGVAGELYIGGVGLAEGYINQPKLTAEAFIDNPFKNHPSQKLYRTQDVVKLNHNDELIYLGRSDSQIKLRGYRIELQEIEQKIIHLTATEHAVVKAICPPNATEPKLVAYVEASVEETVLDLLKVELPPIMVPDVVVSIVDWPISNNGKIARKSLPLPHFKSRKKATPASTETEKKLVNLWQSCLAIEGIGIDDHFFELGGHSLKALELIGLIQAEFAIELPLKEIVENPTIKYSGEIIDNMIAAQQVLSSDQLEEEDIFII